MVWKSNLPGSGPIHAPVDGEDTPPGDVEIDWSGEIYMKKPRPSPAIEYVIIVYLCH
jgi:hypothetical protein